MTAAIPVTSPVLYRRAVEVMKAERDNFRVHPLRVLIGLLLKSSEIPALDDSESIESGVLQGLLYEVFSKEPPFDEGKGPSAFLQLFGDVDVPDNKWRNGINSQKGLGCFASKAEIRDTDFRHAERPECRYRGRGPAADSCGASTRDATCRSIQQSAGEAPKLLQQIEQQGNRHTYRFVAPSAPDLEKLKKVANGPPVPTWALIASLYSGSPYLSRGRAVVSEDDLLADLGLSTTETRGTFSGSLELRQNREIAKMTEPVLLACLQRRMYDTDGFVISFPDLINFYLSLKPRAFVILTGISGTGKSRLPRLFAQETRLPGSPQGSNFKQVPVQPNWNDATSLMGFYNSLHEGFEPGPAIEAFRKAHESKDENEGDAASYLLLDELNLARVEHYFADFLSVMESRRLEDGEWTTDPLELAGGRTSELRYMDAGSGSTVFEHHVPARLPIPDNLFIIGTVNVDESTQGISNKVLDRANTIEFEEVYLSLPEAPPTPEAPGGEDLCAGAELSMLSRYVVARSYRRFEDVREAKEDLVKEYLPRLEDMNALLKDWRCHFGNRTRDDICMYLAYAEDFCDQAKAAGVELRGYDMDEALDRQILQKVLPRVRGTREELENGPGGRNLFDDLEELFDRWGCERSVEKIGRMRAQDTVNFWEA